MHITTRNPTKNPEILKHASEKLRAELLEDEELVRVVVEKDPASLKYLSEKCREEKNLHFIV